MRWKWELEKLKWKLERPSNDRLHVFEKIGTALNELGHEVTWFPEGSDAEELIKGVIPENYEALLLWQRLSPVQNVIIETITSRSCHKGALFLDFGFSGDNATVVFNSVGVSEYLRHGQTCKLQQMTIPETFDVSYRTPNHLPIACPNELIEIIKFPFVFLPIEIPEFNKTKNYNLECKKLGELIRRVLFLSAHKYYVVIRVNSYASNIDFGIPKHLKERYVCVFNNNEQECRQLDEFLIQNMALLIGGNSNTIFRGVLYNKPIITLQRGWCSGTGVVHEVEGMEAFNRLMVDVSNLNAREEFLQNSFMRQVSCDLLSNAELMRNILCIAHMSKSFYENDIIQEKVDWDKL